MNTEFQKPRTVVLLGDTGVGKTTLIKALKRLGTAARPTSGPSDIHEVTYNGVKIVIVDVGGASTKNVTPNTIRYARVVLLTYDITKHETLDSCKYWHQFAILNCKEETVSYALVGCKSDLNKDRAVAWDNAERMVNMINANKLLEVSATKTTNCGELMNWLHGIMKEGQDNVANDDSVRLDATPTERKCSWC